MFIYIDFVYFLHSSFVSLQRPIMCLFCLLKTAVWKITDLNLSQQALVFTCLQYKSFENIVGKGEIACYEKLLLFSQCFLPFLRTFCHFHQI